MKLCSFARLASLGLAVAYDDFGVTTNAIQLAAARVMALDEGAP